MRWGNTNLSLVGELPSRHLVLLGRQTGQVLQSALDLGRDCWGHGQMVTTGLETVLIGDVRHLDWDAFGGGVAELALSDLDTETEKVRQDY